MVKKLMIAALISALSVTAMCGCEAGPYEQASSSEITTQIPEREHLYWKDVECRIVKYDYNMAAPAFCWCWIEVVNDEYGLKKTIDLDGEDADDMRDYLEAGNDTIVVEMRTKMFDSTGEVVDRYLTDACRIW